jgi:bleomycin hydrolase
MKVKLIALATASLLFFGTATAQKKQQKDNGGITAEMMQQMKKGFGGSASDKALRNIMVNNSPAKLAMN